MSFFREATRDWLQRLEDLINSIGAGSGNFSGPVSSSDNAVVRFNGTSGNVGQNSVVTISDGGNIAVPALATVDGVDISVADAARIAHAADAANPHSVTKAQVGLSNVTDDAQLKRSANDISSFTQKTTPIGADIILIEDSAASGAKKYATLGASALLRTDGDSNSFTAKTSPAGADIVLIEDSAASGAKKKCTITQLGTALSVSSSSRDPIWDAPTTGSADDDEFTVDTLASGAWTIAVGASSPGIRDGAVDPTVTPSPGHYRSSVVGSTLIVQCLKTESFTMHKTVAGALTTDQLWFFAYGTASNYTPAQNVVNFGLAKNSAGSPDNNNRAFLQANNAGTKVNIYGVLAGVTQSETGNTSDAIPHGMDGLYLRVAHNSGAAFSLYGGFWRRNGLHSGDLAGIPVGPIFNAATDRIVISFTGTSHTGAIYVGGSTSTLRFLHFVRRMPTNVPWFAQV